MAMERDPKAPDLWCMDGRVIDRRLHAEDGRGSVYVSTSVTTSVRFDAHEGHRVRVFTDPDAVWALAVECLEPDEHILSALSKIGGR